MSSSLRNVLCVNRMGVLARVLLCKGLWYITTENGEEVVFGTLGNPPSFKVLFVLEYFYG